MSTEPVVPPNNGAWSDERLASASDNEVLDLLMQLTWRVARGGSQGDEAIRIQHEIERRLAVARPALPAPPELWWFLESPRGIDMNGIPGNEGWWCGRDGLPNGADRFSWDAEKAVRFFSKADAELVKGIGLISHCVKATEHMGMALPAPEPPLLRQNRDGREDQCHDDRSPSMRGWGDANPRSARREQAQRTDVAQNATGKPPSGESLETESSASASAATVATSGFSSCGDGAALPAGRAPPDPREALQALRDAINFYVTFLKGEWTNFTRDPWKELSAAIDGADAVLERGSRPALAGPWHVATGSVGWNVLSRANGICHTFGKEAEAIAVRDALNEVAARVSGDQGAKP